MQGTSRAAPTSSPHQATRGKEAPPGPPPPQPHRRASASLMGGAGVAADPPSLPCASGRASFTPSRGVVNQLWASPARAEQYFGLEEPSCSKCQLAL